MILRYPTRSESDLACIINDVVQPEVDVLVAITASIVRHLGSRMLMKKVDKKI